MRTLYGVFLIKKFFKAYGWKLWLSGLWRRLIYSARIAEWNHTRLRTSVRCTLGRVFMWRTLTYFVRGSITVRLTSCQIWFGFEQTSKSVDSFNTTKQLNPNQSNRVSGSCQLFMRIKTFIGLEHNIQILDEHFSN